MSSIDDYLQPLHEGIWEVTIPKEQVTEPPGSDWKISSINVPTPGTIASLRKGQYHLHETSTEYKVHLDRYDPVHHPVLHLVDDAPLLLMISETVITLISLTRRPAIAGIADQLQYQTETFRTHIAGGILTIIIGTCFILLPDLTFYSLTNLFIPVLFFLIGLLTILGGFSFRSVVVSSKENIIRGCGIIVVSLVFFTIPARFWSFCLLFIITLWMIASAFILLKRVIHGRKAVPEGFVSRILIAVGSMILGAYSLIAPDKVFYFFLDILGLLTIILGGTITLVGIRLRELMIPTKINEIVME